MPTSYHEHGAKYCKAKAFRNNALSIIITASLPSTKRKSTIVNGYLVSLVYFVYHCVKKQEASHWQFPLSQWRKTCARSFINTSYTSSDVSFIISSTFLQTKSILATLSLKSAYLYRYIHIPPSLITLVHSKPWFGVGTLDLDLEGSALVLGWGLILLIPVTLQDNVTRLPLPHKRRFIEGTCTAKVCNPNARKGWFCLCSINARPIP